MSDNRPVVDLLTCNCGHRIGEHRPDIGVRPCEAPCYGWWMGQRPKPVGVCACANFRVDEGLNPPT